MAFAVKLHEFAVPENWLKEHPNDELEALRAEVPVECRNATDPPEPSKSESSDVKADHVSCF